VGAGLTLEEILACGERALAEERCVTAAGRAADTRALEAEEREAMRPPRQMTTDDFIISEGFGYLAADRAADGPDAEGGEAGFYGPSAWCRTVADK